jgi:hypothetical protein
MMTLTDAYCLYNRARGTDLVSPDDLVDACKLLGSLGLGMHIRELPRYIAGFTVDERCINNVVRHMQWSKADPAGQLSRGGYHPKDRLHAWW